MGTNSEPKGPKRAPKVNQGTFKMLPKVDARTRSRKRWVKGCPPDYANPILGAIIHGNSMTKRCVFLGRTNITFISNLCEHEAIVWYVSKYTYMKNGSVFCSKNVNVRKPYDSSSRIRVGEGSPKKEVRNIGHMQSKKRHQQISRKIHRNKYGKNIENAIQKWAKIPLKIINKIDTKKT